MKSLHEIRLCLYYICCLWWGVMLANVTEPLGAWLEVYAKMKSGVQGCVLECFAVMLPAFWSWEKGWKTSAWAWHMRENKTNMFVCLKHSFFCQMHESKSVHEESLFRPFRERKRRWCVWWGELCWAIWGKLCKNWLIAWFILSTNMAMQPIWHECNLVCTQPKFTSLIPMERGRTKEHLSCWKQLEMKPLIFLKISMNKLRNPDLKHLEIF